MADLTNCSDVYEMSECDGGGYRCLIRRVLVVVTEGETPDEAFSLAQDEYEIEAESNKPLCFDLITREQMEAAEAADEAA